MLDVMRAVHFYEAILASAAIVLWHFYFVIFDPEYYPLNMSMITGRAHPRDGSDKAPLYIEPKASPSPTEDATERTPKPEASEGRSDEPDGMLKP
jgi:hypothetical protein